MFLRTNALAFCSRRLLTKKVLNINTWCQFYKTFLFVNKESWCVCPRLFLPVDLMFLRTNTQAFFRSIVMKAKSIKILMSILLNFFICKQRKLVCLSLIVFTSRSYVFEDKRSSYLQHTTEGKKN
jgi:hypothetical protein